MIYTPQTKKAMEIAFLAHRDQKDKGGAPYIFHPIHLAEQLETETEITAALLHDVVEDSEWTFEDLKKEGISEEVIRVLRLLTHPAGEDYMTYIRRIMTDETARKIKKLDMAHNMDGSRLPPENKVAAEHFKKKYTAAWELLNSK